MKLSSLKVESARIDAGVWVGDIPDMGDLRLKVRASDSVTVRSLAARLYRAVSRDDKDAGGSIKAEAADRIGGEVLARAVLLDWDGLTDDAGAPIPYALAAAHAMLIDPDFRAFRAAVEWASANAASSAATSDAAVLGNSVPLPSGG